MRITSALAGSGADADSGFDAVGAGVLDSTSSGASGGGVTEGGVGSGTGGGSRGGGGGGASGLSVVNGPRNCTATTWNCPGVTPAWGARMPSMAATKLALMASAHSIATPDRRRALDKLNNRDPPPIVGLE